jgi:tRNA-2-methylthio-N6-dimethylallyladenosine synthase
MFAEGEGRKDAATHRLSGRARDNRLVHVTIPEGAPRPRPGDIGEVEITYAAPHHLNADAGLLSLRRTPGGDVWQARAESLADEATASPVGLGMPGRRTAD